MKQEALFAFLDAGVSRFHSVAYGVKQLEAAGFLPLSETQPWTGLTPGQGYYLTRNGSTVAAFVMPEHLAGFRLTMSHGDSPTFAVKGIFPPGQGVTRLEVEGYGGMLMSTWMDRPLTLAGRAMVKEGTRLEPRLVYLDRDLLVIPNLCPHFDRDGVSGKKLNAQVDLQPILGGLDSPTLLAMTAQELNVKEEDILSLELTLCPRQKAVALGAQGEFFTSPRIDDLECAAATLEAFLHAQPAPGSCPLWTMVDNEEVGSGTRQGALGSFLYDLLGRIAQAAGADLRSVLANSMALSTDNGHAVHPNHPEKSDPLNGPVMNGGVLVKTNASKRYTTDGVMEAILCQLAMNAQVPLQIFANRADIMGGSTLGNLAQHSVSIPMADIGTAQLAMHSCVETAGLADATWLEKLTAAFYTASITCIGDGRYEIL